MSREIERAEVFAARSVMEVAAVGVPEFRAKGRRARERHEVSQFEGNCAFHACGHCLDIDASIGFVSTLRMLGEPKEGLPSVPLICAHAFRRNIKAPRPSSNEPTLRPLGLHCLLKAVNPAPPSSFIPVRPAIPYVSAPSSLHFFCDINHGSPSHLWSRNLAAGRVRCGQDKLNKSDRDHSITRRHFSLFGFASWLCGDDIARPGNHDPKHSQQRITVVD